MSTSGKASPVNREEADGIPCLQNLGPKSAAMLKSAGITTATQLRQLGSVKAFVRVRASRADVSLNLLWALEGALTGEPWQQVAREHRLSLLLALEAFNSETMPARAIAKRKPDHRIKR